MRTLIIIILGLLISTITLWLAPVQNRIVIGIIFSIIWLILIVWNLRIGMSHGYTFAQELPIHLILYIIPIATYWGYIWFKRL